jgi:hypothetical protein
MDVFDMLIAQRSVAGEVQTCLQNPEPSLQSDDQQALSDYACDRSNLPWIIFRAAHRANHVAALPARARSLLAALARTVDAARPFAAIFARRELLTGRALQSMRTFYRSLDDLESSGLITRPPQTRYNQAGLFGRAYLHLTPKAAALLGLVEAIVETANTALTDTSHEQSSNAFKEISFTPRSASLADGAIYKDLIPTSQKRQPGRLPEDLHRLRQLGFREFLIFKLMREAREKGKRLSDVVEASWVNLKRAHHPISYLRKLLGSPIDFAFRAHSNRQNVLRAAENQAIEDEAKAAATELAGRVFASADGVRRYVIANDATHVTLSSQHETQTRVKTGLWIPDFLRALRAGTIVPATTNVISQSVAATTHPRDRSPDQADTARQRLADIKRLLRKPAAVKSVQNQTVSPDPSTIAALPYTSHYQDETRLPRGHSTSIHQIKSVADATTEPIKISQPYNKP